MILINYPAPDFKVKEENGRTYIRDTIRKKWLVLTPEEWVRQNFIHYLVVAKNIPRAVIAVEKTIAIGELKKRFDIVVYKGMKPWIIVECKEPGVALSGDVLQQAARYNMSLSGAFLVITNGEYTMGWSISQGHFEPLADLPVW